MKKLIEWLKKTWIETNRPDLRPCYPISIESENQLRSDEERNLWMRVWTTVAEHENGELPFKWADAAVKQFRERTIPNPEKSQTIPFTPFAGLCFSESGDAMSYNLPDCSGVMRGDPKLLVMVFDAAASQLRKKLEDVAK